MGAFHTETHPRTIGTEVTLLGCTFYTNAASSPATVYGKGFSVTYSGSGVWVVTFPKAAHRIHALATGAGGAAGAVTLACAKANEGSGGALAVTITSSGGADIAAATDNWISLIALVEGIPGGN